MNQFFYTYEAFGKKLLGSFNVHYVVRAAEVEPGQMIVMLDDGHEESQEKEVMEKGKPVVKRERNYVLSQIMLVGEDIERFKKVMAYPTGNFPSMPTVIEEEKVIQMDIPFETK